MLFGTVKSQDTPEGGMWRIQRIHIAQEFGWSLEYVDSLSEFEIATILGVWDGENNAQE